MGLKDLVSRIDSATKTALLGDKVTQILRFTFITSEYEVLHDDVLDDALILQKGDELVRGKRDLLIEYCKYPTLESLGFETYDAAIAAYKNNLQRFIKDFNIDEDILITPPIDSRNNSETVIPVYGECNGHFAFPHPYQYRLKKKILPKCFNEVNPSVLISMPTGAGKTILGMEIIIDLCRNYQPSHNKAISVLWIVNSKELAEQSLQSFLNLWKQKGDHKVIAERFFGKFDQLDSTHQQSKVVFATFDLLVSRRHTTEIQDFLASCDFLFIDEAHASEAVTYSELIHQYKRLNQNHKVIGLTATPYRTDDDEIKRLKDLFKDFFIISDSNGKQVTSPMKYLIDKKYLSNVSFDILDVASGKSRPDEYYRSLHTSIVNEIKTILNKGQNTIIFAESKAHAIALSIYLSRQDLENGLIVGETKDKRRNDLLKNFGDKTNSLSILVNHQILATGIDVPGMNTIMILSDINSPSLALQVLGRAMRGPKNGGNAKNKIYLTPDNRNSLERYLSLEYKVLN